MSSAPKNDRQAKIAAAAGRQGGNGKALAAAIVAVLVVVGVVLALWLPNRGGDTPTPAASGSATGTSGAGNAAKLPKGVKDANAPIVATNGGVLKDGVPTLQIFEDFQCPICKQAEDRFGAKVSELGKAGKINVVYYVKTFMDDNLRNDSSTKVGNAAACAADAGKFEEYHDKIYAKQPAEEGPGYSDEAVQAAATEAGISGPALDTWKQCVASKTYASYLKGLEKYTGETMGIRGTPEFYVNNKVVSWRQAADGAAFEKALFDAAK